MWLGILPLRGAVISEELERAYENIVFQSAARLVALEHLETIYMMFWHEATAYLGRSM